MIHRLRQALVIALVFSFAPAVLVSTRAHAQPDWGVKRDPFDKRVVARYKAILARAPSDSGALAKLVGMYKRYRSVAVLIGEYEQALEKDPGSFALAAVLGNLHLREGDHDKALPFLQRAAAAKPGNSEVQASLGDLYRRAGKAAEARAAFDQALASTKSKPLQMRVLRSLADLSLDGEDIKGARAYFDKYIALDPGNVQIRIELGDALALHGQTAEAIEVFKQTEAKLRSDPAERVELIARIGQAHEKAGEEDAAVREYRRAMSLVGRTYYLRKELTGRIVEIYRRRQGLTDLIAQFEKAWPASKRDHFELDMLARLYEETGNQEKAIAAYKLATKKAPYELETQRRLISLLENSGREAESLKQYEAVIKVAPGEPRFQLELAERYWNENQQSKALEMLARMETRFPGDAGVHAAVADLYTRWGKEDRALKAYERLTRIEPSDVTHLVTLGEQYFQRGQKDKAAATWKKIIARKTPANFARLGEVYAEHDLRNEALAMYSKAIKLEAQNPDHYKGRAAVYERLKMWESSIGDWDKVLELTASAEKVNKPARKEARRRVVQLYRRWSISQINRQIIEWRRKFTAKPPDVEAGRFLVEAFLADHKYDQARETLEGLLRADDKDVDAMQELVTIYHRGNEFDKAERLLLRLVDLLPGREREFYTRIAEIKTDARQDDEAIRYVQKALEKSPNDPVAHMRLAERYEAMQNEEALGKAVQAYENTIKLDPRNYTAYFRLARLYQRETSNHPKAAQLYREMLKRATDTEILEKAGREAINFEELTHTLGDLEGVLAPMAFTFGHKPVYRRILVELYERYVPALVEDTRRPGTAAATAARLELERLGNHGLKPLLEALNDDKYPGQQRIAVDVLGYLGNKGAAAPLVRLAMKTQSDSGLGSPRLGTMRPMIEIETRIEALTAAGRLGDARIIPELIELSTSGERGLREAAIFGLGRTRDKAAVQPLLDALGDYNESVQTQACLGLSFAKQRDVVSRLIEVVSDQTRLDTTRAACAHALGMIGDSAAVPALTATLSQGNDEAQRIAAYALGLIGDPKAIPALLAANFERHEQIRRTVVWALGRLTAGSASPYVVPEVLHKTRSQTFDAEGTVMSLASELEPQPLSPALIIGHEQDLVRGIRETLERHTDVQVRMLAGLDGHETRLDLGALTDGLEKASSANRARAIETLGRIGTALLPDLTGLVHHRDTKVRSLALSVLAKIDSPEVAPLIEAALRDDASVVRRAAMESAAVYARRHPDRGMALAGVVERHLGAKSWLERTDAARALGMFGRNAPTARLIAALADRFAYVRMSAARSLGEIGNPAAASALTRATRDPDPEVAKAARASLQQLRKK